MFSSAGQLLPQADLLFIVGTSLKVYPFAGFPGKVLEQVPRILINNNPVAQYYEEEIEVGDEILKMKPKNYGSLLHFGLESNERDVYIEGDCQEIFKELANQLGWTESIVTLMK